MYTKIIFKFKPLEVKYVYYRGDKAKLANCTI